MKHFSIVLITYIIFILLFTIFSFTFFNTDIVNFPFLQFSVFSNRLLVGGTYTLFILLFIGYFVYFLNFFSVKKNSRRVPFIKVVAISSLLVFSFPGMLSYDIFNYIASAKVTFFYKENPYVIMPIAFSGEPLLTFMHAANKTALYGPSWILLTYIPHALGLGYFFLTLYMFKLYVFVFYLLTVLLLYRMTKDIFRVGLFALCPLVLIETFVSGHNDIVMMFFAVMSFFMLEKKQIAPAILFLTISILIKFATMFLLPVFLLVVFKIITGKMISWKKMYLYSMTSMLCIFLLSSFREEIYPWYAIWFLVFLPLVEISKRIKVIVFIFTFSLLFRYVPYIVTLNHFGLTPYLKMIVTFIPVLIVISYYYSKRLWQKVF